MVFWWSYVVFFLFTSFITLKKYLNFNSTQNFTLLLSNLVLLAHSRFESFIYSGLILLLLIIFKELPKGRYSSLLSYIIYPALIFPTILQRLLTSGIFELNDGNSKQAFKFFVDNTAVFFNKVISTDQTQYIYPLMFLGLLAALYWTWKDLRADAVSRKFTIIVTITFLVSWYIITSHYWSRIDDPFVSRHYLPFALLFVICLFRLLSISRESIIITPFLLTLFVIELLQAQGLADKPVGIYSERFYVTNDLLKRYSDSEKAEVLIVNNSPKQYILQGFSAITIDSFKKLASQSQLKDFKKILENVSNKKLH